VAVAATLGLVLAFSPIAQAEDGACSIGTGRSVDVPLVNADANHVRDGYNIRISVGGGPAHSVQVDTGSTGIVVPRPAVPDALWSTATQPGHILYDSDDLYLHGKYVKAPVKLGVPAGYKGTGGEFPTTGSLDVLVVDCACDIDKTATAPEASGSQPSPAQCSALDGTRAFQDKASPALKNCRPSKPGMGMMGVGFARGTQPSSHNPFLHLEAMDAGTMHPGYIIREHHIQLGLNQENTKGFRFVQLQPSQVQPASRFVKEWLEPQVCVALPTAKPTAASLCGSLLMDTGINYMMLTVPSAKRPANLVTTSTTHKGQIVPPGTPMTVTVPGAKDPILTYSVNDKAHMAPSPAYVSWRGADGTVVHVNTGRHTLAAADYAYDAACGQLGFLPRSTKK
jgi:hypothetical protein